MHIGIAVYKMTVIRGFMNFILIEKRKFIPHDPGKRATVLQPTFVVFSTASA